MDTFSGFEGAEVHAQASSAGSPYIAEPLTVAVFLLSSLLLANVLLAVRYVAVHAAHGPLKQWLIHRSATQIKTPAEAVSGKVQAHDHKAVDEHQLADQVLIEAWEGSGALLLQLLTCYIMFYHNSGCTMFSTSTCLQGWPLEQKAAYGTVSTLQALYSLKFAWYAHNSLKHRWGLGPNKGMDNFMHHSATLVLVFLAFYVSVMRAALLAMVMFNFTNPLLNGSRACNMMGMVNAKKIAFLMFTLTFFFARIIGVPAVVLKVTIPAMFDDTFPLHLAISGTINVLMVFLYLLSVYWFKRIVDIAMAAFKPPKPSAVVEPPTKEPPTTRPHSPASDKSNATASSITYCSEEGSPVSLASMTCLPLVNNSLDSKPVAAFVKKVL